MFNRVSIIGVGLIGGSLALALRRAGIAREIVGCDRSAGHAHRAAELGIVDTMSDDIVDVVHGSDLVVLSIPVAQMPGVLEAIRPHLADAALVIDTGSTKADVVLAAQASLADVATRFVPCHPIAGREVHGPDAALATLFDARKVILTPTGSTDPDAANAVTAMWQACGARVATMTVDRHDRVFAAVSHLPHLLSYALVAQIVESTDSELKLGLAGAGFRDFTRIAASSPEMWRDIALANRDALLAELDRYLDVLARLRGQLADHDGAALEATFAKASEARQAWRQD